MKVASAALDSELEGDRSRRKARFFWRLAVWSGGLALPWLLLLVIWFWPQVQEGWQLFAFVLPLFLMLVTALVASFGAWLWAVKSLSQKRSAGSARFERALHVSAVLFLLLAAGIIFSAAVKGIVTGEVIATRYAKANIQATPVLYWFLESLWFSLSGFLFFLAIRGREKLYVEP